MWADGFDSRPGLTLTRTYWNYWSFTTVYYHSNFKLGAEGESVGLFSPSGSRIDAVTFGPQSVDISYGRFPDGAADWGYFGEPTAGTTNRAPTLTHNLYRAPKVTISPTNDALMVTGEVQVALSADPGVSEIRYTTNGAIPTSSSLLYTQSFTLVTSGVIRARAYAPDRHPGPVATRTFLRHAPASDLPLISLVIDPRLLFDPAIGIYTNLFKEREVPGNLQFCTTPSNTGFQIDAGFRLYGLNTFLYPQKPFTVYLDSKYGQDLLPYQLFPDKPLGTFDRFILRNGNDDWRTTFFRDTLGQKMLKGVIDNATQGYRPCSIFLNGSYYGLINIQEKMDEMYCTRNYGVATTNIDFFENDGFTAAELLDAGTADGWTALLAFLSTNSLANPAHYAYVKSQVDLEDMVDYVAAQTFVVETSWTHNRKWWRDRNPGGRWRWCFVDLDRALDAANVNNTIFSSMASGMVVFRECLANAEFRAFCAQRMLAHLSSSFSTNRILPIIDAEALSIRAELVQHIAKYSAVTGIPSIATWDTRVESIRSFCRQRPAAASQQVLSYFATGQAARVQVDLTGGGRVLANHVALIPGLTNTFAGGLPLRFTAAPDIGQAFVRWEVSSNGVVFLTSTNGPDLDWTPRNGESVQAVFAPAGVSLLPAVIATDTALTAAGSPYYATGDIFVPSNTTLSAGPGVEILLPDTADIRVQGRLQLLGTTGTPVRVMPNTNANARVRYYVDPAYADGEDLLPRWGGISFEHATHTGELVNVLLRGASLTKSDPVNHKAAISALGSDLWLDGVDLDEVQFPIFVQEGRSTVLQNSRIHLAITGDGINIKRAAYARVENCEMTGALEIDADAIDYDGVQGGIIRGNRLHDFLGENDDAIDIGEGALDLLVESNLIYRMSDKGVSIGQASTAIVRHNIIRDCGLGVGIKDAGSYGLVEYNTFHKTGNTVALYEKNLGVGGGAGDIRGSIFSETTLEPVTVDALSTAQVSYCLSDTLPVAGLGNLNAQPQFLNAASMNFHLQTGSAAVDAGPPGDPADADGSRRDIGARPFDWREGHVMVSEIHYHPADTSQSEFVELHNPGGAALDLTGFRFAKGVVFDFPPATTLAPGQYLVIASGTNGLAGVTNLLVWTTGVLDNAGEIIELHDADSNELDRVAYASFDPWPAEPDGAGPSLSVINPRRDNSLPENWYASGGTNGTPGAAFDHQLPGPLAFGRLVGGGQSLGFAALPGLRYVLEFTEDLIVPDWQPVDSGYRGLDGRVLFEQAPGAPPDAGCYRIRVETP